MSTARNSFISLLVALSLLASSLLFACHEAHAATDEGVTEGANTLTLYPGIPIVVSENEAPQVHRAVADLQRDLQKVFGTASPVFHDLADVSGGGAIVIIGPESEFTTGQNRWMTDAEAHRVFVEPTGNDAYLVLQGSDMRGAIYAIYTLSEEILGIPPLWFWASWEAETQTEIEIPLGTDIRYDSPYVQYRSWYPNDRVRYNNWRQGHADREQIWAETMMRLKLNTIVNDNLVTPSTYAEWLPNLPEEGQYNVQIWKVQHQHSDSNAKIDVFHRDGLNTTYVDFTEGTSGWVDLGTHWFQKGKLGFVRNTKNTFGPQTNLRTSAVKFTRVDNAAEIIVQPGDSGYLEREGFGNSTVPGYNNGATRHSVVNIPGGQLTDDAQIAKSYGLILANTHISPLGARIPESDVNNIATIQNMFDLWSRNIDALISEDVEVIWTLAFRGHRDVPFWDTFHDAPQSNAQRAAIIEEMLEAQLQLLKDKYGNEPFTARTTLYNEVSDLYAAGLLEMPDDPNVIYNFVAARRDHYPPDGIRDTDFGNQPLGYYMNFQFTSTGSHYAQAEGPWKIEANYRTIDGLSTSPLVFAEGNMGNLREHLIEGSALASLLWHWDDYNSDAFMEAFATQYFGTTHASAAADLYERFIDSYWQQKQPTISGFDRQFIFQDLRYSRVIRDILQGRSESVFDSDSWLMIYPDDNNADGAFEAMKNGTQQTITELEAVVAQADLLLNALPNQGKSFFNDMIRTQAMFMLALNQTLHHVVLSREAELEQDWQEAYDQLLEAQDYFEQVFDVMDEQDHGIFATWHSGNSGSASQLKALTDSRDLIVSNLNVLEQRLSEGTGVFVIYPLDSGYTEVGRFSNSSVTGYANTPTRLAGSSNTSPPVYAQWSPTLTSSGEYSVQIWKVQHADSDPNAKIEVRHRDGVSTTYLDYTQGVSEWVDLGTFTFNAGNAGYVRNNKNTFMGVTPTRASAVRFVKVE
ncbi:glycosyl hydrolase 115 family protein [Paenibacillus daejeonensis]|uniref:golvesin C-terminal-like domain-containing protein n=1 Tax=Paenibacillus daejeonensis TaxID=135193 RepID=UPI00036B5FC8|nr:glycosyl hydrolase 115 family protein [Paenibacillus daejeonensis]